jgi:CRP-like cAMP-binding protein
MTAGDLGRVYQAGETIVKQGEVGECMYVVQSGKVEVMREDGASQVKLAELKQGDFFGEMALFDKDVRSATVRAQGEARLLTIDKKMFLRKVHEDPSLAYRVMEKMSRRIRELNEQVSRLTNTPS